MPARASLIEDAGSAASDPGHFFRAPEFLAAEGVTHTLVIEAGADELRLPLIVREIEGSDRVDAISPYGYPGASGVRDTPPDPAEIDWAKTGLVSLFIRDRIGEPPSLAEATVRSEVQLVEGESGIRKRLREQIRRNERRGWLVESRPGAVVDAAALEGFEAAYAETMARTGAGERYLFSTEYFRAILGSERAWLLLASRERGSATAGAIVVASDGLLHYFLGGTADEALEDSPMKNLFAAMIAMAGELGLPLNLGGGVSPGDSLESFKRGFATGTAPFRTHEVICDPAVYETLSAGVEAEGFFPAYRAPR
ncbi:MAG: GNAT family N-acetyltransferase [Solirubrobacterales bacterium]